MTTKTNAMVIGANGGIGSALVKQLATSGHYANVYAVSRSVPGAPVAGARYVKIDSADETQVESFCRDLAAQKLQFSCIICCTGMLHHSDGNSDGDSDRDSDGDNDGSTVKPEKRLEDINAAQLLAYFKINTVIPALWIKHSERLLKGETPAALAVLSARVGSISDNKLGGWYGYRSSKAALNMLVKTAQVEYRRRAPNVSLLCYHPGTVNTDLSRPFQRGVTKEKLFSSEFTADQLIALLPRLHPDAAPYYLDWQGKNITW